MSFLKPINNATFSPRQPIVTVCKLSLWILELPMKAISRCASINSLQKFTLLQPNGLNGAARPKDKHSKSQRWEQGVEANNLAGIPAFVMVTEYGNLPRRITAMLEIKNPWQVTPALIDAVINSIIHSPLWLITSIKCPLMGPILHVWQSSNYMVTWCEMAKHMVSSQQ